MKYKESESIKILKKNLYRSLKIHKRYSIKFDDNILFHKTKINIILLLKSKTKLLPLLIFWDKKKYNQTTKRQCKTNFLSESDTRKIRKNFVRI